MDELVRWLGEQLDEDERIARRAAELCGCHPAAPSWVFGDEATDGRILVADDPHPDLKRKIGRRWNGSYEGLFMAEHIVRHDPARVLREIDAARKTLMVYEAAKRNSELPHPEFVEGVYPPAVFVSGYAAALEHVLRLAASVYADRPGYREEWRP